MCLTCGKPLTGRQRMFCSIPCRNSANGKKTGGSNRTELLEFTCETCGTIFTRRAEYLARVGRPRDCSLPCHNRRIAGVVTKGPRNGGWKDGRSPNYYRQFLRDACEWCNSARYLVIHHMDEDRTNNNPVNLVTLCKACHQRHHAESRRDPVTGRYA